MEYSWLLNGIQLADTARCNFEGAMAHPVGRHFKCFQSIGAAENDITSTSRLSVTCILQEPLRNIRVIIQFPEMKLAQGWVEVFHCSHPVVCHHRVVLLGRFVGAMRLSVVS